MASLAPLRFCAEPGCPKRVSRGRCDQHQRALAYPKPSAHRRGYTTQWERFRLVEYPSLLLDAGLVVQCGARLRGGLSSHSRCATAGVVNSEALELDHDPPLSDDERRDPAAVCDPARVGFLCKSCHTVKTNGERAGTHS